MARPKFGLRVPVFDLVQPSEGYHGLVSEKDTVVEVQPPIRATPNVCFYRIVNKHHGEAPFIIRLRNEATGEAELIAKRPLNCEKRKNYKFRHHRRFLRRQCGVTEPSYLVGVDEGRLYDEILTLQADDQDCSPKYGDICRYELLTKDQPFSIDSEGVVRNTEPLDYEKSHNHILSVVAYDCGMERSQPVMVTIKVNRCVSPGMERSVRRKPSPSPSPPSWIRPILRPSPFPPSPPPPWILNASFPPPPGYAHPILNTSFPPLPSPSPYALPQPKASSPPPPSPWIRTPHPKYLRPPPSPPPTHSPS
ncbi:Calsyntenin-1 [Penaeus vannamei]|uniref:Calsyntenin-1 n=1 Tax=Penaeus vannamei TaxID=6689 RepID=A0A3R7MBJ8_PENVA|nr:Calsyntenin-1 [Penaeus vannamei]